MMNLSGVQRTGIYLFVGVLLWVFVLKSGVHATLAGVALAFAIPLKGSTAADHSPLRELEHTLHPWVAYGILPLFAFANAGISLSGISLDTLTEPIPWELRWDCSWQAGWHFRALIAIAWAWHDCQRACAGVPGGGVGWRRFTMSLFTSLAFDMASRTVGAGSARHYCGSLLAALCGFSLLRYAVSGRPVPSDAESV